MAWCALQGSGDEESSGRISPIQERMRLEIKVFRQNDQEYRVLQKEAQREIDDMNLKLASIARLVSSADDGGCEENRKDTCACRVSLAFLCA